MSVTIECDKCGYCTDIELTSDTNPTGCPKCDDGELMISGTDQPLYGDDGEYNSCLYEND